MVQSSFWRAKFRAMEKKYQNTHWKETSVFEFENDETKSPIFETSLAFLISDVFHVERIFTFWWVQRLWSLTRFGFTYATEILKIIFIS